MVNFSSYIATLNVPLTHRQIVDVMFWMHLLKMKVETDIYGLYAFMTHKAMRLGFFCAVPSQHPPTQPAHSKYYMQKILKVKDMN